MDAVVAADAAGRDRLLDLGLDPARVKVIPDAPAVPAAIREADLQAELEAELESVA